MLVDRVKTRKVFPKISNEIMEAIDQYGPAYGLTAKELPMFLAQAGHESGGFTIFEENLNYGAVGLANTWPNRFAVLGADKKPVKQNLGTAKAPRWVNMPNKLAVSLDRKPMEIANIAYGDRMGNLKPGDGWKYRGRGIFQLTGFDNYSAFAKDHPSLDVVNNPDILLRPAEAVISALWYWKRRGLNKVATDVAMATKLINGGSIGLADREHHFKELTA